MRDLILHNFRWKALSLGLAIIVWFVIKSGAPKSRLQTLEFTVPIMALADPAEKRVWHLVPAQVRVRVSSPLGLEVSNDDVVAFVNLAGVDATAGLSQSRRIRVDVPAGVEVVRVDPGSVMAQFATLPAEPRTNKVNSP